jgi:NADPH:quinone reductase-like Zn-dependent oxidoreductase
VIIGGPAGGWIAPMDTVLRASLLSLFVKQEMGFMMSKVKREDLMLLRDLMESGKVTPVIDKTYPLNQARDAVAYQETGRARGKVVIAVTADDNANAGVALR